MKEFHLQDSERVILESDHVAWMKSRFSAKTGRLILTNRRLVFTQSAVHSPAHGFMVHVMAGLINNRPIYAARPKLLLEIPCRAITRTHKESNGFNTYLAVVYHGQNKARFSVGKAYDEWESALRDTRSGFALAA